MSILAVKHHWILWLQVCGCTLVLSGTQEYCRIYTVHNYRVYWGAVLLITLSRFLSVLDLRMKKSYQPKSSARVLTSLEKLRQIEENKKQRRRKHWIESNREKRKEKQLLTYQGHLYMCMVCIMHVHVQLIPMEIWKHACRILYNDMQAKSVEVNNWR